MTRTDRWHIIDDMFLMIWKLNATGDEWDKMNLYDYVKRVEK